MKTIKTITLSAALAALFLSAGAFAGAGSMPMPKLSANVTVIHKNSAWPLKSQISTDVCAKVRCTEA